MSLFSYQRTGLLASCGYSVLVLISAGASAQTTLPEITVEGGTLARPRAVAPRETAPAAVPAPAAPSRPAGKRLSQPQAAPVAAPPADPDPNQLLSGGQGSAAGIPANQLGTAVTVVSGADLQLQQVRHAGDALRGLPGVELTGTGSVGALTQVRIRGAEGRHTRVIVDGIDVNTTKDGEFDFSNLLAEEIEKIEVVRGPMSGLYGSGALGGVINIITRDGKGPVRLMVRTEAGSFGTKDVAARLSGGNENAWGAVSGQWRDMSGFNIAPNGTEKDGTRIGQFAIKGGFKVGETARIDLNLRHVDKRAEYDDFGAVVRPLRTADDADFVLRDRGTTAGGRLLWDTFGGALTHEFKANYAASRADNLGRPTAGFFAGALLRSKDEGDRKTLGYAATYRLNTPVLLAKHEFTAQLQKQWETFTPFSEGYGFFDGNGTRHQRNQLSAAGEWRGVFADRLALTAGVRRDDNDTFQDFTTWRSSVSYDWREVGLRPHASVGTAAKIPGMYDQFGPNLTDYQSNPNLKPETSFGWDAGLEARFLSGRALIDVTYFKHDLKDKIGLTGFDLTTFRSFPENALGTSTRQGIEVAGRYLVTPGLSLGLAYTYTDARQPNGDRELRRAPHGGRADVRYVFNEGKGNVSLAAIYNGSKPDRVFDASFTGSTLTLDPYWLMQVAASYKISPNIEIFGRVENALNSKYQEIFGYNTAGVAAYAGVRVTFDDLLGTAAQAGR